MFDGFRQLRRAGSVTFYRPSSLSSQATDVGVSLPPTVKARVDMTVSVVIFVVVDIF